jgi:5'-methylthioadenosine nucleosidase
LEFIAQDRKTTHKTSWWMKDVLWHSLSLWFVIVVALLVPGYYRHSKSTMTSSENKKIEQYVSSFDQCGTKGGLDTHARNDIVSTTYLCVENLHSVLINIAMEAEAAPFIEHLGLQRKQDFFPSAVSFVAYTGMHNNVEVTVVTNGKDSVYGTESCNVGTVSAAMATFLALQACTPDIIINAGTAGGFGRKGAAIGSVFVVTGVAFHDRRIPIPGYDTYGTGKLESTVNGAKLAEAHGWSMGVCTTGNSLDKTTECDEIMLANDASVKDMEAAAIAWSAALTKTPFLAVKVVTDIVDGDQPAHEEFMENLATASRQLQHALPLVLEYVEGKTFSEL